MRPVAAQRVISVRSAWLSIATFGDAPNVDGLLCRRRLRLGLDAPFASSLAYSASHTAPSMSWTSRSPMYGLDVVIGIVAPVLRHRQLDRVLDSTQPLIKAAPLRGAAGAPAAGLCAGGARPARARRRLTAAADQCGSFGPLKIFNGGHYRRSEDGRLKGSRGTLSPHRARGRCR